MNSERLNAHIEVIADLKTTLWWDSVNEGWFFAISKRPKEDAPKKTLAFGHFFVQTLDDARKAIHALATALASGCSSSQNES
jgi:hypothetical protein